MDSRKVEIELPTASVYQAVRTLGSATPEEVARHLREYHLGKVEEALTRLVSAHLVEPSTTVAGSYHAYAPGSAFPRALSEIVQRLCDDAELLTATAATLDPSSPAAAPRLGSDVGISVDRSIDAITGLLAEARHHIDSLLPGVPARTMLRAAIDADQQLYGRGISGRTLYPEAAQSLPRVHEYSAAMDGYSLEVRTSMPSPVRLLIIDRRIGYISHRSAHGARSACVIRNPNVLVTLQAYFDLLWEFSQPLRALDDDDEHLSTNERTVLRGLAHNLSLQEIADHNAMSTATVSRAVNKLGHRIGTTSRFTLGIEAQRRGWLRP
ncbi:MAG: hypothetical protein LBH13_02230 [Cellulomonadaceae bacterium]|jgi:DNA-binding CsgD family transcriptional regulator|nr:hypothetical protein [Cellulomonadaceae bacterium]